MRVEDLINELEDMMNDAKVLPLTGGKAVVDTEAVLDILDDIQDALPGEVRQAKSIVADRSQILAEAKKEALIKESEGQAEAILKIQQANAEGLRMLNEVGLSDATLRLKALEAFGKAADGQATKIIIPSEIQNLAGLVTSIKEVAAQPEAVEEVDTTEK